MLFCTDNRRAQFLKEGLTFSEKIDPMSKLMLSVMGLIFRVRMHLTKQTVVEKALP